MVRWPRGVTGLCYGGDYNPEQWPESLWERDVELMRTAGVNLVSLGVFAWSRLEPEEGRYDFGWLDRVLDLLHGGGVAAALATPTASPPPWFSLAYPDALPVTRDGVRLSHGSRDTYCASAPAYRAASVRIATALANRYAGHPALALWHVHNEYGTSCHCDVTAEAFRCWLRARYTRLDALNDAWTTAFWGQHYSAWEQVRPPLATQYLANPAQELDFRRFTSDELRAAYREQRDALHAITPDVPITTNFVFGGWVPADHWHWSSDVDLVAIDHYPDEAGIGAEEQVAFAGDLARGFAGGAPWLLIESAPNLIYTRGRMHVKEPGRMARHSLGYVARGSRGAMFFQWRAPAGGAERFHSALVPHAGPDSRVFREAVQLGASLRAVAEAAAGTVRADAAILWDPQSWWALQGPGLPAEMDYLAEVRAAHRALWRCGITTDFAPLPGQVPAPPAPPGQVPAPPALPQRAALLEASSEQGSRIPGETVMGEPCSGTAPNRAALLKRGRGGGEGDGVGLSAYKLVVVPALYLVPDAAAEALRAYVAAGGHLLVTPYSGIADECARIRLGGYPGALRELLGVRVEEFHPLPPDETVVLSTGAGAVGWAETVHLAGAEAVASYTSGVLEGQPAITRHRCGAGIAWYVSTRLTDEAYRELVGEAARAAGADPTLPGLPPGVEAVRRSGARDSGAEPIEAGPSEARPGRAGHSGAGCDGGRDDGERESWLFLFNHTDAPVEVAAEGVDLLTGQDSDGSVRLAPGAVAVLREPSLAGRCQAGRARP